MIFQLIIYLFLILLYYGLPLTLMVLLIRWTAKLWKQKSKVPFFLNIALLLIITVPFAVYVIQNSRLNYDIRKFEGQLSISIPDKYEVIRREKLIFGPEFSTYIELKFDSINAEQIISSAKKSPSINISNVNGGYLLYQHKFKESIYAGLDTKTRILTLREYYTIW